MNVNGMLENPTSFSVRTAYSLAASACARWSISVTVSTSAWLRKDAGKFKTVTMLVHWGISMQQCRLINHGAQSIKVETAQQRLATGLRLSVCKVT